MFTDRDSGRLQEPRVKQPWPADKPFRILSLDGGGIRGIFSASVINDLTEILPNGEYLGDYFDLISGTSTGGIIAIGLGLRRSTDDILRLYMKRGKEIFPPFWSRHRFLALGKQVFAPLHRHDVLEKILREEFKGEKLGDSTSRLLIPAFVGPHAQVAVFKTDHHPDYRRDWRTPVWEVARATSAAPTFFEGHRYNLNYFLDGGVWANNPVMLAVVEALSSYDISVNQVRVLSIGTGNAQPSLSQKAVRAGMVGWRAIITTAMYLTTDTALSQARLLLGHHSVIRIEPSQEAAKIKLDDWEAAKDILPSEAAQMVSMARADVEPFFHQKVAPRERHSFVLKPASDGKA